MHSKAGRWHASELPLVFSFDFADLLLGIANYVALLHSSPPCHVLLQQHPDL